MLVVTWNMQGANHSTENKWNIGVKPLMTNYAHYCCLQECGSVPLSAVLVDPNFGGEAGLAYYTWGSARSRLHILFYPADPNGNRCNLAIVSDSVPQSGWLVYPAFAPVWRPALGLLTQNNEWIFCIHAISPGGPDALGLLDNIDNSAMGNWVAAGDFNQAPVNLMGQNFDINPPNQFTYSVNNPARYYDYAANNMQNEEWGAVLDLIYSDHFPVQFEY